MPSDAWSHWAMRCEPVGHRPIDATKLMYGICEGPLWRTSIPSVRLFRQSGSQRIAQCDMRPTASSRSSTRERGETGGHWH